MRNKEIDMTQINWEQFKIYKQERPNPKGLDNFLLLIEFVRSYYNFVHIEDVFEMVLEDELSRQMLVKREITDANILEEYLYKQLHK
ncbi:MAG: hypothetical protein PHO27_01750 [Sulfuricurvum sp.]|nr:hypothetical protein [Sulfuricurvum sp.]